MESVKPWLVRGIPRLAILATAIGQIAAGDPYYGAFCLAALAITLVPALLTRRLDTGVPLGLELALLWLMLADMTFGNWLGLYVRIPWYDKALHLSSSTLIGVIGFLVVYVLHLTGRIQFHPWIDRIAILLVTLGVGAIWEIGEYAVDQLFGRATQGAPHFAALDDTMVDLMLDALGGVIGAIVGARYMYSSESSRERVEAFARDLARRVRIKRERRERGTERERERAAAAGAGAGPGPVSVEAAASASMTAHAAAGAGPVVPPLPVSSLTPARRA
jgi:hypothetical protein